MNILFAVNDVFLAECLGPMILSAQCKRLGYNTRLLVLKKHNIYKILNETDPDIIAYSAMTPDIDNFVETYNRNAALFDIEKENIYSEHPKRYSLFYGTKQ